MSVVLMIHLLYTAERLTGRRDWIRQTLEIITQLRYENFWRGTTETNMNIISSAQATRQVEWESIKCWDMGTS